MANQYSKSIDFFKNVLLTDLETGERQYIRKVRGGESGLDHLEVTTQGKNSSYKHRIYTEEV